MPENRLFF